jgi:hypothetical protein
MRLGPATRRMPDSGDAGRYGKSASMICVDDSSVSPIALISPSNTNNARSQIRDALEVVAYEHDRLSRVTHRLERIETFAWKLAYPTASTSSSSSTSTGI